MAGSAFAETTGLFSAPPGGAVSFAVVRNDSKIGMHHLTFEGEGDNLTVRVAVELRVGIGPIALFRYKHSATEIWRGGQLISIDTKTNDDGTPNSVSGHRTDKGFMVEGTKAKLYQAPDTALPATHWNRKMLDGPMINTQDGRLMNPIITPMGKSAIPLAAGGTITANHFAMTGDAVLDTWYDDANAWVGLSFKAGDGSEVIYERM